MIPRILHFSVPDPMTGDQAAIVATARKFHPHWEVKIWYDDTVIDNARLLKYASRAANGAQRADLIRLDVLSAFGGVYLDADVKVLRSLDNMVDHYEFFIGSEDGYNLTNALIGAARRHPAIEAIIDFLETNEPDWAAAANETTGPILFGKLLRWRSDVHIMPRETFYPYNWNEEKIQTHRLSYCEHLWEGSWTETPVKEDTSRQLMSRIKGLTKRTLRPILSAGLSGLRRVRHFAETPAIGHLERHDSGTYSCTEEVVSMTVHGQKIVLDGRDLSITPDVALRGCHEWPEEAFVRRILRGGDWFVDIGANVGTFSILAASRCGPFGRVLAFEPNPHVRRLLSKSAVLNWYHDRIQIFEIALGDAEGSATLSYLPSRLGDAQIDAPEKNADPFRSTGRFLSEHHEIDVPVHTLEAVIPVDVPIKIMKIDAEGHEAKILKGSRRLLESRAFDFIMLEAEIELFPRKWNEILSSLRALIDFGYVAGTLDSDGFLIKHSSLEAALRGRQGKTFVFSAS